MPYRIAGIDVHKKMLRAIAGYPGTRTILSERRFSWRFGGRRPVLTRVESRSRTTFVAFRGLEAQG